MTSPRFEKDGVYLWTEAINGERPVTIDSINAMRVVGFCNSKVDNFSFNTELKEGYRIYYLEKPPIKHKSVDKDWRKFYKKHPGSGGIFSFSQIKYYGVNKDTAILYYWHKRNGLNGHGALAVMKKSYGEWALKYKTYLWMN